MDSMLGVDLTDLSRSYPFLHLSRKLGVEYGKVLRLADNIDHPDPGFYGGRYFISELTIDQTRVVEQVCHASWRWQFPPEGRGL
jgi:hypothetical protein